MVNSPNTARNIIATGSNSSIINVLRREPVSLLTSSSPRTLKRIGRAYGLGRRGATLFAGVLLASAQIAAGQTPARSTTLVLKNVGANGGTLSTYSGANTGAMALPSPAAVTGALDTTLNTLATSIDPAQFACTYKVPNANWAKAGKATNWRGRNTSEAELAKLQKTINAACNAQRTQASKSAVAIGKAGGEAIASVYTSGAQALMTSKLNLAQQQLNAATTAAEKAAAALAKVQQNREANKQKHAANLAAAKAKFNSNLQTQKNAASWGKMLRNAKHRGTKAATFILTSPLEAGEAATGAVVGALKYISGSVSVIATIAIIGALLAGYGMFGGFISSGILRLLRLIRDGRKIRSADELMRPAAKLIKSIEMATQTNAVNIRNITQKLNASTSPNSGNRRQSPSVSARRQSPPSGDRQASPRRVAPPPTRPPTNANKAAARALRFGTAAYN